MKWVAMQGGGHYIDWRANPLETAIDPYWVLADSTGYADYGSGGVPDRLPALLQLAGSGALQRLREALPGVLEIPPGYQDSSFCTARFSREFLYLLHDDPALRALVVRIELGLPVLSPVQPWHGVTQRPTSTGKLLIGVIDDGCPYAHRGLRRGQGTRLLGIWDQESTRPAFEGGGTTPREFGYGREAGRPLLESWMARARGPSDSLDEDRCYELARYPRLRRRVTHGAHVLGLMCGAMPPRERVVARRDGSLPGLRQSPSAAVEADIVFVQFPRDSIEDSSGGWLCVHVLDALKYILSLAGTETERVVVNLSYGSQVGPHDGSSTLECAIVDLCRGAKPELQLCLPSGNSYARRAHACIADLSSRRSATLQWRIAPGSEKASFVEIWLPADAQTRVRLLPPGSTDDADEAWVDVGACRLLRDGDRVLAGVCSLHRSACGDGAMILLQVAATAARGSGQPLAPAGNWTIELLNAAAAPLSEVHAYIARNEPDIGMQRRGRGSEFVDPPGWNQGRLRPPRDDEYPQGVVRRRGTMNWTFDASEDSRVHVVAGHVLRPEPAQLPLAAHAPYSSAGPGRPRGSGAVKGPAAAMPTDESPALPGMPSAGTRSRTGVRIVGTSTAAPQLARALIDAGGFPAGPRPRGGQVDDLGLFGKKGRLDTP